MQANTAYVISAIIILAIIAGSSYNLFRVRRSKMEMASVLCKLSEKLGTETCRLLAVNGLQFERSQHGPAIHSIFVSKNNILVARISVNVNINFVPLYIQFPNGQNECRGVSFENLPQAAVDSVLSTLHIAEGERA